jgi:UPF0755 protein
VTTGESSAQLADDLYRKGVIRSAFVFEQYLRFSGARSRLQAGQYRLDRNMSMRQIADALQRTSTEQLKVTIVEGYTAVKAAEAVQAAGIGTAQEYLSAEKDGSWTADFLASRPPGADLEGYLFPDTYTVDRGAGVRELIRRQLDQFGQTFNPQMRSKSATATAARPAQTIESVVIMASMVEREANKDVDRPKVCSVYYNRLEKGMRLQVDATVLYAEGVWKKQVLNSDLAYPSPYNTYLHAGLPPGPISNPGESSLRACVEPAQTDFLYYFTDRQGVTRFARTAAEFESLKGQFGVSGS